ncbi:MAG: hypothetical protein SFW67_12700 [Myxococcaceae bacterium]|nr:hypothetical protein [Myxococcaceae bacterium]
MNDDTPTPTRLLQQSRLAKDQGTQFLTAGLGVGAIGALGALAGAVCPLCVVATPALLGAGLVRAAWGKHLERKARAQPSAADTEPSPPLSTQAP